MMGVHDNYSLARGKPKLAVACNASGRLVHVIGTLARRHPVRSAIGNAPDRRDLPQGKSVQFCTIHAKNAVGSARPQVAVAVTEGARDFVIKQSLPSGVSGDLAIL